MVPNPRCSLEAPPCAGGVLIIDDDDLIAAALRHVLAQKGCDVDLARNRRFAEELMAARRYAVVVVDPYLTGEVQEAGTLLPAIRNLQPEASIVVLSAYGASEVAGAPTLRTTIIRKPQPLAFLSRLVIALLRNAANQPAALEASENETREVES